MTDPAPTSHPPPLRARTLAWWRSAPAGPALARRYVLAGAAWSVVAAAIALVATAELAPGLSSPSPVLGFGRLHAAYVQAMFFGAVSLPLAGGWLHVVRIAASSATVRRRARLGWELWNAGLVVGVVARLAGASAMPDPWSPPAVAGILLWLGAALWAWALWTLSSEVKGPLPATLAIGIASAIGLVLYLGLGVGLVPAVQGAGQALVAAALSRGLPLVWAALAAFGLAAAVVAGATDAPLFGRRALYGGALGWLALGALSVPRDLAPDLIPAWLARVSLAANAGLLAPAMLVIVAIAGARIGGRALRLNSEVVAEVDSLADIDIHSDTHADVDTDTANQVDGDTHAGRISALAISPALGWSAVLASMGIVAIGIGAAADAMLGDAARRMVQGTAWAAEHVWLPPLAGLHLAAMGVGYAVLVDQGARLAGRQVRRQAAIAITAAVLVAAALAVAGLAESAADLAATLAATGVSASAPPASGALALWEAWLRLPAAVLAALSALLWLSHARSSLRTDVGTDARSAAPSRLNRAGQDPAPTPSTMASVVAVVLGVALMVTLFVPVASLAADMPPPSADADAPAADETGTATDNAGTAAVAMAAEGLRLYSVEGCVACHTQRVRDPLDAIRSGPRIPPGEAGLRAHLPGERRAGPDLTWAGDRFDGPELLGRRLSAAHGPGGVPAFEWLFEANGPTGSGMAIVSYLGHLRHARESRDGAAAGSTVAGVGVVDAEVTGAEAADAEVAP